MRATTWDELFRLVITEREEGYIELMGALRSGVALSGAGRFGSPFAFPPRRAVPSVARPSGPCASRRRAAWLFSRTALL